MNTKYRVLEEMNNDFALNGVDKTIMNEYFSQESSGLLTGTYVEGYHDIYNDYANYVDTVYPNC